MAVKLIVQYPYPKDVQAFEKVYQDEHVPMAVAKLAEKIKIVATKVLASPQGTPAFYRVAEIHFPSRQALEVLAIVPAQAESDSRVLVEIPFDFSVGNTTLKAGSYRVQDVQSGILAFSCNDGQVHQFVLTLPQSDYERLADQPRVGRVALPFAVNRH